MRLVDLKKFQLHSDIEISPPTVTLFTFWLSGMAGLLVLSLSGLFTSITEIRLLFDLWKWVVVAYFSFICVTIILLGLVHGMQHDLMSEYYKRQRAFAVLTEEEFEVFYDVGMDRVSRIELIGKRLIVGAAVSSAATLVAVIVLVRAIIFLT